MSKNIGSGDKLARGAVRATFGPDAKVSDETWAAAFDDFDSERFLKGDKEEVKGEKENVTTGSK